MESKRSNQVVGAYRQHKLDISAFTAIQGLLIEFEADYAASRRWARYGVVMLIGIAITAAFFFTNSSAITIS